MPLLSQTGLAGDIARGSDAVLKVISCTALLLMLAASLSDVIARYAVNAPIFGAAEIIAHFLAITVFSALPIVTASRRHITVDLFQLTAPKSLASLINRILDLISAVALFLITYSVLRLALDFWDMEDVSTELSFPKHIVAGGIVILSAFAGGALVIRAIFYPDDASELSQKSGLSE